TAAHVVPHERVDPRLRWQVAVLPRQEVGRFGDADHAYPRLLRLDVAQLDHPAHRTRDAGPQLTRRKLVNHDDCRFDSAVARLEATTIHDRNAHRREVRRADDSIL